MRSPLTITDMLKYYLKPSLQVVIIEVAPLMTSGTNTLDRGEDYTSGRVGGDAAELRKNDWSEYEGN